VEADLACPPQITEALAAHPVKIQTVIHCAGETSFASEDEERARDVQLNGPLALLETLGAQGLQDWSQVSTAFVCGRRSGIVYESEADLGQEFHNPYERLKLESEIRLKQACAGLGVNVRIFRPTIVIGAAPVSFGGTPSNLFFAFLRVLMMLARSPDLRRQIVRIKARPQARFNIVPVDYVAAAVEKLSGDPEASQKTFHLAVDNPPTQQMILDMISAQLGLCNLRLLGPEEELTRPSPIESRLSRMMLAYREYLEQEVVFDCSAARHLIRRHGLESPVIDHRELDRLIELAPRTDFASR
jgi:nucleoside-diphosphate-sugar epimerase